MDQTIECRLAGAFAREIRESSLELTQRWLQRIASRVAIDPARIFPTDELLNHIPVLVGGIAEFVENPAEEISEEIPVIAKAVEMGKLRYAQGFSADQILREYELLGGVLFAFLVRVVDDVGEPTPPSELLSCAHRVFRAIEVVQRVTTAQFLELAQEGVKEREERLRSFNRMVTHELKNRIGAVVGAAEMVEEEWVRSDAEQFERFMGIVVKNADAMRAVLRDLLALSQTDAESVQKRVVRLPEAMREVARQFEEEAEAGGVEIRLRPNVPDVEVNAPVLELCLSNYLSNAIKYRDRSVAEAWVEIGAEVTGPEEAVEAVVWVRDNGVGVPPEVRGELFQRFFRAETPGTAEVEGTGLGLSIVRETVEALGGSAWAEFEDAGGSNFKFSLPVGDREKARSAA
jgi:signal transduction histidine kinase